MKLLIALTFLVPNLLWALPIQLGEGKTQFLALGNPGFLKIKGKGTAPRGTLTISAGKLNGKVSVDLKSLDTGMSLRNQHMKEKYLQVEKFPVAQLEFKNAPIGGEWSLTKPALKEKKIPATLTLHGQSQTVEVVASVNDEGELKSTVETNVSDFNIDIPTFMGVTVADKVKIEVEAKLVSANN